MNDHQTIPMQVTPDNWLDAVDALVAAAVPDNEYTRRLVVREGIVTAMVAFGMHDGPEAMVRELQRRVDEATRTESRTSDGSS